MSRKFVFPLLLGFMGMFVCHIIILIAFGSGFKFPIYIFAYPIVYPTLAILLTINKRELWFSDGLLICMIPFLYWYLLLWSDNKINFESFDLFEDSGLLIILPFTAILSFLMSYYFGKRKNILTKKNNKNQGTS